MRLLPDLLWNFTKEDYATPNLFNQAVTQYQREIRGKQAGWQPDEIVVDSPTVHIIYECWPEKSEPLSPNETLVAAYDDGDYEEREVSAQFTADNGKAFTASELLYKLHQHLRGKALVDHTFFEGITPSEEPTQPPLFYLYCGS